MWNECFQISFTDQLHIYQTGIQVVFLGQERQNWFKARWSVKMVRDFLVPLHTFFFFPSSLFHIFTESEFAHFDFTQCYGNLFSIYLRLRSVCLNLTCIDLSFSAGSHIETSLKSQHLSLRFMRLSLRSKGRYQF